MYDNFIKRILDFSAALVGLILLSPLFIGITLLLWISNRGKPFFFQERPGKDEKVFLICKFKTMNDKKDDDGELLQDEKRITKVGGFIRQYSLDEIPQLLNVIKGDMSLVGPRPLMIRYIPRYNDFQKRRHEVRPGVSGWAQVNGRNAIGWDEKFSYDVWYVENQSFLLDLKILFLTLKKVLIREGINNSDEVSMPEFMGTADE